MDEFGTLPDEVRSDRFLFCPVCGEGNYTPSSAGMLSCRECRSLLVLDDLQVVIARRSFAYGIRRRLGRILVGSGLTTAFGYLTIAIVTDPRPFLKCGFYCLGPPYFDRNIWILYAGLALLLAGLVLRRKRWP